MANSEEKVTLIKVNNASIEFNNDADITKQYKVKSVINIINNNTIESFSNGEVTSIESGNQLCTFYLTSGGGISINYTDHPELDTQIAIITIINKFMSDVTSYINTKYKSSSTI